MSAKLQIEIGAESESETPTKFHQCTTKFPHNATKPQRQVVLLETSSFLAERQK
jgi:hypothetical protein